MKLSEAALLIVTLITITGGAFALGMSYQKHMPDVQPCDVREPPRGTEISFLFGTDGKLYMGGCHVKTGSGQLFIGSGFRLILEPADPEEHYDRDPRSLYMTSYKAKMLWLDSCYTGVYKMR